jgi:acetyltransferase-like isoleucine patch superfamily enzyme
MPLTHKGHGSYGNISILFDTPSFELTIGNYCSIAGNVTCVAAGHHRTTGVSSFPFYELYGIGTACGYSKGNVHIGNDVWIGANVSIMNAVSIGTGAVIAAHAVLTKDVPPYAIVAGNPGCIVKYRFDEDIRDRLLASEWWKLTVEELTPYADLITGGNLDSVLVFLGALKQ